MVRSFIPLVVLAGAFQVISCQGPPGLPPFPNVPEQCRRPPEGVDKPHECCTIPPFFKEADFEECGFTKHGEEEPIQRHRGPPDCTKQICMMKKYNLIKEGDAVDHEAAAAFLDEWAETNPDFKTAVGSAKERCVGKQLPGPPQICEANRIVFCISSTIFGECPKWGDSEGCQKLKAHIEECSPHFKQ